MKLNMLLSASILTLCSAANAQTAVEITDPARIAAIERHAQELGAQPTAAPAAGEHTGRGDRMHRHHMRKHGMRHHKDMQGQRGAVKPAADVAAPPATN